MPSRLLIAVAIAFTSMAIGSNTFWPGAEAVAKDYNACMAKCQAKGKAFRICLQICG
jgi:hypothetical protein